MIGKMLTAAEYVIAEIFEERRKRSGKDLSFTCHLQRN